MILALTNTVVKKVILDEKLIPIIIDKLKDKDYVIRFADALMNLTNKNYIGKYIPGLVTDTIGGNKTVKNILINSYKNIFRNIITESSIKNFMSLGLTSVLGSLITEGYKNFNVSNGCAVLFNYTLFNPSNTSNEKFRFYYTKKILIDSTKSKNDFLTYENCLNGHDDTESSLKYQIKPIYVVGKIIDRENQSKLRNSIYYEKYNLYCI